MPLPWPGSARMPRGLLILQGVNYEMWEAASKYFRNRVLEASKYNQVVMMGPPLEVKITYFPLASPLTKELVDKVRHGV